MAKKGFDDEAGVVFGALAVEVDTVVGKQLGVVHGEAVPVDQGGVGVTRHALLEDGVVAVLPVARDLEVEEDDLPLVAED